MKYISNLYLKRSSDLYEYIGDRNTSKWSDNIQHLLDNHKIIDMSNNDIKLINNSLGDLIKSNTVYPNIKGPLNTRFGRCWFLNQESENESAWDICVQTFDDDWFLVNIGSDQGWYNYYFICDQIDGVLKLIEDNFKNLD